MRRRTFLMTSAAGCVTACGGGGPVRQLGDATAAYPPIGRFVRAGDLRIHAWEQGAGRPVIMLHGASGNLRDFAFDLGPRVARTHRAIAFDRPGQGYSDRPAERGGDPAVQARVLRAAALEMGVERPILVGHSWGAALAMAWALADPEGVAGVVTVSGFVMPWSDRRVFAELVGLDRVLIGFYFDYLQSTGPSGGIERFVNRIFRPQMPPAGYLDYVGGPLSLRTSAVEANKADIAAISDALRRQAPDYARVQAPVEIISGTADFIIKPDRHPIPFDRMLPNSTLTLLPGVGHMAHHVHPELVLAAIDRIAGQAA